MISGRTTLIAHLGFPTEAFKAPMIYNPYFEDAGIDAVAVPMGVQAGDYAAFVKQPFRVTNLRGALVTMPHNHDARPAAGPGQDPVLSGRLTAPGRSRHQHRGAA